MKVVQTLSVRVEPAPSGEVFCEATPREQTENSHLPAGPSGGMLGTLEWLALEAKYLDRSQAFYEAFLDLAVRREREGEVAFAAGDSDLILRSPGGVPRGGIHTHYAFSIPAAEYDQWYDRLDDRFDLVEHTDRKSVV